MNKSRVSLPAGRFPATGGQPSARRRGVDRVGSCREPLTGLELTVRLAEAGLLQPFDADVALADGEGGKR